MKKLLYGIGILIIIIIAMVATATRGEEPTWIQYTEPLAGENSPNFSDTLNRPAKTIWQDFLVEHTPDGYHNYSAIASHITIDTSNKLDVSVFESEHNPDGSHKIPIPATTDNLTEGTTHLYYTDARADGRISANSDITANTAHRARTDNPHNVTAAQIGAVPMSTFLVEHNSDGTHNFTIPNPSEFALHGTGTGNLASGTFSPTGLFTSAFSVWGVVTFERAGVAESLLQSISTEYSQTIINFYKGSSDHLTLAIGSNTYTSTALSVSDFGRPLEIGCTFTGTQVYFWLDGQTDTAQAASGAALPTVNMQEEIILGAGLQGDILYVSSSKRALRAPSSWYTPYREGLSQCPGCELQYDMDEQSGSTLDDRMGLHDLSVIGTWQEYAEGY